MQAVCNDVDEVFNHDDDDDDDDDADKDDNDHYSQIPGAA